MFQGVFPNWQLGDSDPSVLHKKWNDELLNAGFTSVEAITPDSERLHHNTLTIIASSKAQDRGTESKVSILSEKQDGPFATALSKALERHSFVVDFIGLTDDPKQDVISILDLESGGSFIASITPTNYALLKNFLIRLGTLGILWLNKACQMQCPEPEYAQILGLARTLRNELAVEFATLELDDTRSEEANNAICKVYQKFQYRSKHAEVDPDYEYALTNGVVHIPRFHWISVAEELAIGVSAGEIPKRLEIGKRGFLQSLHWVEHPPHAKLSGIEASVEVRAVGMNFKVCRSY